MDLLARNGIIFDTEIQLELEVVALREILALAGGAEFLII